MKRVFSTSRTALPRSSEEKASCIGSSFVKRSLTVLDSAGRQWFIRSALISDLPDDIVNDTVMEFANTPVGCSTSFEIISFIRRINVFTLFSQPGYLSWLEGRSRSALAIASRSRREKQHSRSPRFISGRWTSKMMNVLTLPRE